ncbi:MAG: response regulator [Sulfurimonadaceae bacterium]|jgi:YesN/AraC family two-component response regulator|nr:response regulator [Sulfurimonadaceae bacterium]
MPKIKKLQHQAKDVEILYVEGNDALRINIAKLLRRFFKDVHTVDNAAEGWALFKKYSPAIVISDIRLNGHSGIALARKIRQFSSKSKIIFFSASDEKEYLYSAIELNIFRFLKKPIQLETLIDTLLVAVQEIQKEADEALFFGFIQTMFHYQQTLIVMYREDVPILANQSFLDFFASDRIEIFHHNNEDLGTHFLPHEGFLFNKEEQNWFNEILMYRERLFHIKMLDKEEQIRHFLLKAQKIPQEETLVMLSFNDITELNLLKLFDSKQVLEDTKEQDTKMIYKLLEAIERNSVSVTLYNFYKGLSVTNSALITRVDEESLTLKTNYMQQKAIQAEQKTFLVSEALPFILECNRVVNVSFEKQSVILTKIRFVKTSPIIRSTVRLVPEEEHMVTLFIKNTKYQGDLYIEDISLDSVRLNLSALPPGLEDGAEVIIDMVLKVQKAPLIINTKAILWKKIENQNNFSLIFMFDFKLGEKSQMIQYISKRQMAVIREFKGLQNG